MTALSPHPRVARRLGAFLRRGPTAAVAALAIATACAPLVAPAPAGAQAPAVAGGLTPRDRAIGQQAFPQIVREFGGTVEGPVASYVRSVGVRVATAGNPGTRAEDWTITLLDSPVPNAMATPGGYVYITRGLLGMMNSEAELASVLGHEAAHIVARHADRRQQRATIGGLATIAAAILGGSEIAQLANVGASAWVAGFSRAQENEADTLGMRYAIAAGYDPMAAATMLEALDRVATVEGRERMERAGQASIFSTHPVTVERVRRVRQQAAQTGRTGAQNREAFLTAINGITFGDSVEQGLVSGPSFRHGPLRIGFDAPPGFQLQNSPQAVAGRAGDGSQFVFTGAQTQPGDSLERLAEQVWRQITNNRMPVVQGGPQRINGLDAFVSTARVAQARGAVDAGVHLFRTAPTTVYVFRTVAPAGRGGQFDSLLRSFRQLNAQEVAAASQARRILVVTVQPGDTAATFARRMAPPYNREASFLALNGLDPARPLPVGQRVKIIAG